MAFRRIRRRLRALFRRDALDREMDDELRSHLEMQARDNADAGLSAEEAARLARLQFGHVDSVKETVRARRGLLWLESLARDLRFALRSLRRSPGYTVAVVAILALSIGMVTAIVNVSRRVLLPEIPFPEPERLVILRERKPPATGYWGLTSHRFAQYAESATSFTAFAASRGESLNLVAGGEVHAVRLACVSEDYFAALDASCQRGRTFLPEEHRQESSADVVVLSHRAWDRYFSADPALPGGDIQLGDRLLRVVGILPEGFNPPRGGFENDGFYAPTHFAPEPTPGRNIYVSAIGRLRPGVQLLQAEAEMRSRWREPEPSQATNEAQLEPVLTSLRDTYLERGTQPFRLFLGAVALLHLVGCTAVANLMLSRTVARRRELSVRIALGGSRRRVMTCVMAEALVLSLFAAAIGALIGWWGYLGVQHLLPPEIATEGTVTGFDPAIVGVAIVLGLLTCVLAGSLPAWRAGRATLNDALKEGAGAVGDSRRLRWLRGSFVVAQSALAVALLVGAGLMIESVHRLQQMNLGFDPADKVVLLGTRRDPVDQNKLEYLNHTIVERLAHLPEVSALAQTTTVPLLGIASFGSVSIEGRSDSEGASFYHFNVSPNFFAAMEVPLIAGRDFADVGPNDPPVAIIDDVSARQLFPDQSPIGQRLLSGKQTIEIIGVARSISVGYRGTTAFGKFGPITAQLYQPMRKPGRYLQVILRVTREPGPAFATTVRRLVSEVDPSLVVSLRSYGEFIAGQTRNERHTRTMLQVLSGLALALAAFGLFSVMSYTVAQRRGELGLRLVLGATPGRLVAFVLRRGLQLAILGIVLGAGAAAALTRYLRSLLYETNPLDPAIFASVGGLLLVAAALACWLPARRAARVDPATVLRAQ